MLRDQLLQCADEDLRKIIHRNLGIRQNQITLEEMMNQLEIVAVDKQSELLNFVQLIDAVQDRGEAIRKFVARIRGRAAV